LRIVFEVAESAADRAQKAADFFASGALKNHFESTY
jgi:hypothetical protein